MKPSEITPEMVQFLRDRHLATLTTLRQDGSPHVVAVGFSYDVEQQRARVITFQRHKKQRTLCLAEEPRFRRWTVADG